MPALDGIRGVAVAAVVAFHLQYLTGGYLGVDLFFVLSGFLITSLLLSEASRTGGVALWSFWGRRARRLLPALTVMLLAVAVYAGFAADPNGLRQIRGDALATTLYVANWREIVAGTDYWAMFSAPSPLAHTWSLAIEEQFYLIWPLVFLGALHWSRRGRNAEDETSGRSLARTVCVVAIALGLGSLAIAAAFLRRGEWSRVYFGSDTRAFAILVGIFVAAWSSEYGPVRSPRARRLLSGAGVVAALALGAAWVGFSGHSWVMRHGGLAACSVIAGVVVAAVSKVDDAPLTRVLSWAPLRGLGLISYGVYLYHWPIIVFLDPERTHLSGLTLNVLRVLTTLAVSVLSYRFIETPVRNRTWWRHGSRAWLVPVTLATLVVVALISTRGAPPLQNDVSDIQIAATAKRADRAGGPRLMVIGNSVAYYLARDGFATLGAGPPLTTLDLARIGCTEPPAEKTRQADGTVTNFGAAPCGSDTWERAAKEFRPTHVIFARNGLDPVDYLHNGKWLDACSPEFRSWSEDRMARFARMFHALGAKLVLVTSLPDGLLLYDLEDDPAARSAYIRGVECGNDVLHSTAQRFADEVELVDLAGTLCPRMGDCVRPRIDRTDLRTDGTHFKGRGAQLTAQLILSEIGIHTSLPQGS